MDIMLRMRTLPAGFIGPCLAFRAGRSVRNNYLREGVFPTESLT